MTPEEVNERRDRLKELVVQHSKMSEFAKKAIEEGLVVSMSEGRRIFTQLK